MKKVFIQVVLITTMMFSNYTYGQELLPPVDSYEKVIEGYNYYQQEEYQQSIEAYDVINENDTNFNDLVIIEKMLALIALERYEDVVTLANKRVDNNITPPFQFFLNFGTALDKLERYDETLKLYEKAYQFYPLNEKILYNQALSLELSGKNQEAYDLAKKIVLMNPLYDSPHMLIARICFVENKTSKGLLALNMYLWLKAARSNNNGALIYADEIASSKYWNTYPEDYTPKNISLDDKDDFSDIDELLHNYVSLNSKFKIDSKLDYPIFRQSFLLFNQLEEYELTDAFWSENYVSFFNEMYKKGDFGGWTYLVSSNLNQKKTQAIVSKNKSKGIDFYTWAVNYLDENHRVVDLSFVGLGDDEIVNRNNENYIDFIGKYESGKYSGLIKFYYESGSLMSFGNFDNEGNKDGEWKFYYNNGGIKEIAIYDSGELNGLNLQYDKDGRLHISIPYENGNIHGDVKIYNNGFLDRVLPYTDNEFGNGKVVGYHKTGNVKYEYSLTDNLIEGEILNYYYSGELESKRNFVNDLLSGEQFSYFKNGQVDAHYFAKDGMYEGNYVSYYETGEKYEEGKYESDNKIGKWFYYYKNGQIRTIENYDNNGELNDSIIQYTKEGNLFYEMTYKNGNIASYKYYDGKNNIVTENVRKSQNFDFHSIYSNGNDKSKGLYGKKEYQGVWNFFDEYGVLEVKREYKDGMPINKYEEFYRNGELDTEYSFIDGKKDGLLSHYYSNGNLKSHGYYSKGERDGEWRYYNFDGTLSSIEFFVDGKLNGVNPDFIYDSIMNFSTFYEEGNKKYSVFYDELGNAADTLYNIEGKFTKNFKLCDSCIIHKEIDVVNGYYHGKATFFYPEGIYINGGYKFNNNHGPWKWYFPNGKIEIEGEYNDDNKIGIWNYYHPNGKLKSKRSYINNNLNGEYVSYNPEGKMTWKANYVDNETQGDVAYYINGELDHIRVYKDDKLVSISYYNKLGNYVTDTVINETYNAEIYWKNGKLARKFNIVNGWFEGEYLKYFSNGVLADKHYNVNSKEHGEKVKYFSNGNVFYKVQIVNDEYNGEYIEYYEDGSIAIKTNYLNGNVNGNYQFFDKNSGKVYSYYYLDGVVIKNNK